MVNLTNIIPPQVKPSQVKPPQSINKTSVPKGAIQSSKADSVTFKGLDN